MFFVRLAKRDIKQRRRKRRIFRAQNGAYLASLGVGSVFNPTLQVSFYEGEHLHYFPNCISTHITET